MRSPYLDTGVVVLTHTLARDIARHGVVIKCICPSWVDTELVTSVGPELKEMVDKSVKQVNGTMTPEHVAEGFYRLVTQCENGSTMALMKGAPYLLVPHYNIFPIIRHMTRMAMILDKIFGPQVVTRNQQMVAFTIAFTVAFILLAAFFAWMF